MSEYPEEYESKKYLDNFSEDAQDCSLRRRRSNTNASKNKSRRKRKGLKWKLIALFHSKLFAGAVILVVCICVISACVSSCSKSKGTGHDAENTNPTTADVKKTNSYKIDGVPVIAQSDLLAACETYACTMLLQYYGFDIDEHEFVDNYLITKPVYYGADGNMYGPDMNSAYAGDVYTGYGINAKGMAKCMNNYLSTADSNLTASPLLNVELDELCKKYIMNDTPVMVWATTYMDEPYVFANWIVDYVDDQTDTKIGDTVSWQMHEHCLVLIGFDEENYYFCDSVSGKVSEYDKSLCEKRYEQIGKQAIVLTQSDGEKNTGSDHT